MRKDYRNIEGLAESIKERGLQHPIGVLDNGEDEYTSIAANLFDHDSNRTYTLVFGGRRLLAVKSLGWTHIPATVYDSQTDELELRIRELVENVEREDLTWQEEVTSRAEIDRLYKQKFGEKISTSPDEEGWTSAATADLLGVTGATLSIDLDLASAIEEHPELKTAATKSDAKRMNQQIKERIIIQELAARALAAETTTDNTESQKANLVRTYIIGDFFEAAKNIQPGTIDFADVDPPWCVDVNSVPDRPWVSDEVSGMAMSRDEYRDYIHKLMSTMYRVMSDHSWMIVWFSPEPWFELVYEAIFAVGFKVNRTAALWYKHNAKNAVARYALTPDVEWFFYARKGDPGIVKQGRSILFDCPQQFYAKKRHPTEKPIKLMEMILQTFCTSAHRVLVPFLGSGNTLLAANNLGMTTYGYDINQAFKDKFILKVSEGVYGRYVD